MGLAVALALMGFVKIVPTASHACRTPVIVPAYSNEPQYGIGTVWECDECGGRYEIIGHETPGEQMRYSWKPDVVT